MKLTQFNYHTQRKEVASFDPNSYKDMEQQTFYLLACPINRDNYSIMTEGQNALWIYGHKEWLKSQIKKHRAIVTNYQIMS